MPAAQDIRILLVDDHLSMRNLTRYSLQQIGIRNVTEARNGQEALDALAVNRYDLIISDWNMDIVDGLQLLKALRANPLTQRTPFIMSTANKDRAKVAEAVQAGVNNYIVKPFNVETLRKKIEQVIGALT
ncbi:response regulator [Caenispirillum bisanense]|uniref:Two-component system, chemotaxis family, response regulator CheY n=1 Tax=Caenispirillum bisanense TaxID=414052 RepID=A0A286G4S7_9PROT|nr:response regulator [Caenispirillum bisanense]SOD90226.1 two-component system, chemotaxis family, response regulator CheY [Caenispirillum bisanense]